MIEAIKARRSIRHFLPTPLIKEQLEEIVRAGMAAPSAKNLQPWHFVVTEGRAKERVCAAMEAGIERERHSPILPDTRHYLDGAFETLRVMQEAAAVILITSPIARPLSATMTLDQRVTEICTAQSVGAAIENKSGGRRRQRTLRAVGARLCGGRTGRPAAARPFGDRRVENGITGIKKTTVSPEPLCFKARSELVRHCGLTASLTA